MHKAHPDYSDDYVCIGYACDITVKDECVPYMHVLDKQFGLLLKLEYSNYISHRVSLYISRNCLDNES